MTGDGSAPLTRPGSRLRWSSRRRSSSPSPSRPNEYFLTLGNLENVTRQISLDAPLVFGQTIVLIAGGIDISVGSTMAMAAALAIGIQPYGTLVAVDRGARLSALRSAPATASSSPRAASSPSSRRSAR